MNKIISNLTILLILSASLKGMNPPRSSGFDDIVGSPNQQPSNMIDPKDLAREKIAESVDGLKQILVDILNAKFTQERCLICSDIEYNLNKAEEALNYKSAFNEGLIGVWVITIGTLIDYANRIGGETKNFVKSTVKKFSKVQELLKDFPSFSEAVDYPKTIAAISSVFQTEQSSDASEDSTANIKKIKYIENKRAETSEKSTETKSSEESSQESLNQLKKSEINTKEDIKPSTGLSQETKNLHNQIDSEIAARGGVNVKTGEGNETRTLLMKYAELGNLPAVQYLIEQKNADINVEDTYYGQGNPGRTAIIFPAFYGYADVVEYLAKKTLPGTDTAEAKKWANLNHKDTSKVSRIIAAINSINDNKS